MKKGCKGKKYQLGGVWDMPKNDTPKRPVPNDPTALMDISGNSPQIAPIEADNNPANVLLADLVEKPHYGILDPHRSELHKGVRMFNTAAQVATGIAETVNNVRANQDEMTQYIKALQPVAYENMERYGLNSNPVFTKFGGKVGKYQVDTPDYQVGGQVVPPQQQDKNAELQQWLGLKKKYASNLPTLKNGQGALDKRMEWMQWANQSLPTSGTPVELAQKAAKATGFSNPGLILSSAMEEGVGARFKGDDGYSSAYDMANKNKELNGFPVDGFRSYGLDQIGGRVDEFIQKGYLPQDFKSKMKTFAASNELDEKEYYTQAAKLAQQKGLLGKDFKFAPNADVYDKLDTVLKDYKGNDLPKMKQSANTAAFVDDESAFTAKAAFMRAEQDNLNNYVKQKGYKLTPEEQNFFTLASYNGGAGNGQQMLDYYAKKNMIGNNGFLKERMADKGQIYDNVLPRLAGGNMFNGEGYFKTDADAKTGDVATQKPTSEGTILQTGGQANQLIEAEQGEQIQFTDGSIGQISNDAPTHEEDGVIVPDAHRVLENTSKLRNDKNSKYLKLSPEKVKALTGLDTTKPMSHAEALQKADSQYEDSRHKIVSKINLAAKGKKDLDKMAENSVKLNLNTLKAIPTKEQLFENLFNHQEAVKAIVGIETGDQAKNGGKFQLGGYTGNKSGKKTPAGNSDAFVGDFKSYLENLGKKGFKYENITDPAELQKALYDYQLEHDPQAIVTMWKEGMHEKGMSQAKKLGFVDDKGMFKEGVLDKKENLKKLAELYPDGILGRRALNLAKGTPRIWTDDTPEEQPKITQGQPLDTSINAKVEHTTKKESKFFEPLRWFDVASPVNAYLSALERLPEKYNPTEFNQLKYKLQDPTAALQQNQADFNAASQAIQNTQAGAGAQMANIANLAASKYAANNQVLGNTENQNAQIKNNEVTYNTQVRDKQGMADQQARESFEEKVLTSKAKQQEQKLTALDSLYKTIAENRALNRNGNLIMKFAPAFDQYANYNGYQHLFGINPALGIPPTPSAYQITPTGKNKTESAGGVTGLTPGKSYYNRKTGKTLYFDGSNLIER